MWALVGGLAVVCVTLVVSIICLAWGLSPAKTSLVGLSVVYPSLTVPSCGLPYLPVMSGAVVVATPWCSPLSSRYPSSYLTWSVLLATVRCLLLLVVRWTEV